MGTIPIKKQVLSFALAVVPPIAFVGLAIGLVFKDPEIMPRDRFAYALPIGLMFGLIGSGIGYLLFRLMRDQINVFDFAAGMAFFLGAFASIFAYKNDSAALTMCLVICACSLAFVLARIYFQ